MVENRIIDCSSVSVSDFVTPFLLHGGLFRGRFARISEISNIILGRHQYPAGVSRLVIEAAALATLLANVLKFEGTFTLQVKGSGPVRQLVADVTSEGKVRACATFDSEAEGLDDLGMLDGPSVQRLLGNGYLAFTVDQSNFSDRYQGIVELNGRTLAECLHEYFRKSEQLETAIKVASAPPSANTPGWRVAALMLQKIPTSGGLPSDITPEDVEEAWRTSVIFLGSLTTEELLNPQLKENILLHRLFHEEDLSLSPNRPLSFGCRCSRERVEKTLSAFGANSLKDMKLDDGSISVQCEFCSIWYTFSSAEVDVLAGLGQNVGDSYAGRSVP